MSNLILPDNYDTNISEEDMNDLLHLDLDYFPKINKSPFTDISDYDIAHPDEHLLKIMMDPNYFGWTCSKIFNTASSDRGMEILPMQAAVLRELWWRPFPILLASRGWSKSWTLALYAVLRALFIQGRKIVITGAGFRQSKIIFNYAEMIWYNSPILRDLCGASRDPKQGPHHSTDVWEMYIGESVIKALPIGSGDKIRGQRAHDILADEFSSIPQQIFEEVIAGFGVVALDPISQVKHKNLVKKLKKQNNENIPSNPDLMGNQIIISGTASFAFNHFYAYWRKQHDIIMSQGDRKSLINLGMDPDSDTKKYSIIRIPVELIPEGFMDKDQVQRARNTINSGIFENEYGACLTEKTEILTPLGVKNIEEINIGDLVLTHNNRFRKVTKLYRRNHIGKVHTLKIIGSNRFVTVTPEHPIFTLGDWTAVSDLDKLVVSPSLKEISGIESIKISDYFPELIISRECGKEYISPKPGSAKHKMYDNENKRRFNSVNNEIKLDYDFGLVMGYYLAEGCVGGTKNSIAFALDGHRDLSLEYFRQELLESIIKVFDINAVEYNSTDNTVSITVNSKAVKQIVSYICPGLSHTKFVKPEILFSNENFMRGFLTGYWHGDGCLSMQRIVAQCVNKNLLAQVMLCMSYFGFDSSLLDGKPERVSYIKGRKCLNRPTYNLVLRERFKTDFVKFINDKNFVFKNKEVNTSKIISNVISDFDGMVYNLEVEEDHSYSLCNMIAHNCFAADSKGFFKRSVLDKATPSFSNPIVLSDGKSINGFSAMLSGNKDRQYIMGIDVAAQKDNYAIVILEHHHDHARIVYCWTTNKQTHTEQRDNGIVQEKDYFAYTARKIRNLMKAFNIIHIAMDSQGGGNTIAELLHNERAIEIGEQLIWELNENSSLHDGKSRDSDDQPGLHILEMCHSANAKYISDANHGMKSDFENRLLLFPYFDAIEVVLAGKQDYDAGRTIDTLDDVVTEIDELKSELQIIDHTQTGKTGREHWGAPTVKGEGDIGRLYDDRYSALVIANSAARRLRSTPIQNQSYYIGGGFAGQISKTNKVLPSHNNPAWYTEKSKSIYASYGTVKKH